MSKSTGNFKTLRQAIEEFSATATREALKNGFYDLQAARDEYRLSCGSGGMNHDLILKFMDVQTRLIEPICPQFAEHVWRELLKKEGSVEVLESNVELIKRQLGLEEVEIHSAADVDLAGPHASLLKQNPPSPGSPTAIFVNR
ncbi:unnamed protein product [Microthlaspi erraticum]|uniref:Methionyl/Valyl/Leucyl/Isoleucyl-tRNA synthetase anticodon-binding domain-containing protein n=1 Tax=Microthlaspi erraticum TaxID=1685480 RepID=A0A6D2J8W2_9BRAS|nr:unnamed protein product [Microthlaspi erraticum]